MFQKIQDNSQYLLFYRVDMADKKGKSVGVKRTLTKREQEEIKKKVENVSQIVQITIYVNTIHTMHVIMNE